MLKNKTKKELMEIAEEMGITLDPKMLKKTMIEIIGTHAQGTGNSLREAIKNDLLDQLERDGVVGEFYVDLVNDYMALWDVKNKLIKDIEEKGVSIKYQNGKNQWGWKKNDSVSELQRTNNQMLKILQHLGLKPNKQDTEEFDFDDLEM